MQLKKLSLQMVIIIESHLVPAEVQLVDHLVEQCKKLGDVILVSLFWFLRERLDKNIQTTKR